MSDGTAIQWTEATWNPITGCSVVSPGCTNCYAMKLAGTRLQHHPSRVGLTRETKAGPVWTGDVRFNEQWLEQPIRWRRPRRIFVCAHSDLFHENVPDEWIDRIFAVMALAREHTFQVLTKRPDRMRDYLAKPPENAVDARICAIDPERWGEQLSSGPRFPLPNVWLGTSVEDQKRADERIPLLLNTPAAVRWLSCEPLLGPLDLTHICLVPKQPRSIRAGIHLDALAGRYCESGIAYVGQWDIRGPCPPDSERRRIDWVVVGSESGPGARPMDQDWARSIRDQCAHAGVPFFCKQLSIPGSTRVLHDLEDFPPDLRVRQYPEAGLFAT